MTDRAEPLDVGDFHEFTITFEKVRLFAKWGTGEYMSVQGVRLKATHQRTGEVFAVISENQYLAIDTLIEQLDAFREKAA